MADRESADFARVGPLMGTSFRATTTEHFVLLHEPQAAYVAGASETLEYAYRHFYEVFSRTGFDLSRSQGRLVWICFPQKSGFSEYALQAEGMDLSWLDGYYSTLTNRVAIVQTDPKVPEGKEGVGPVAGGVRVVVATDQSPREGVLPMSVAGEQFDVTRLTHEVAHQLSFNSGIQKRGVMYPLWVSEGLATNFEFDGTGTAGLEHPNPARCKGLVGAYATGGLIPLREFVVQTAVPPDVQVGRRCYAQAWGFFQFIVTERAESLRTYLCRLAQEHLERRDSSGLLVEFTEAFGPPETLEASWNAFLARQARQISGHYSVASAGSDASAFQIP